MKLAFNRLSETQLQVLAMIAMNQDCGHHPRTIKSLLDKGLIVSYDEITNWGHLKRFNMPIDVHVHWCAWCSENYKEETDGDS